ncbi:hypothetical protein [Chelatococcus sp. HY11]|uniref:hypothetical protein n=1 Tax=unclassified Chelatococcus TaxID=2638111 RepID=UPI00224BDEC6|nr:hypothetical protein CHELA20_40040 [Hyphomicrobiales bacterium]CAH1687563.1 hypothetical protein CHELA41_40040 [Hyphomicrobiales bacterium]
MTGKPTMAVGSVTLDLDFKADVTGIAAGALSLKTLDAVLDGIARGDFDIIAVGRSLISNPDWTLRIRHGNAEELLSFSREHLLSLH